MPWFFHERSHGKIATSASERPRKSQTSPVDARFTEVIENELLVGEEEFTMPGHDGPIVMRLRLEFHDEGEGRTRLELRQGPYSPEWLGGATEGWGGSFTKLDALLAG